MPKKISWICQWIFLILSISIYKKTKSSKILNYRIILKYRQAFTMTNNMASSGLWKMLYLPILILTTDSIVGGYMYTSYSGHSNHTPSSTNTSTSTTVTPATATRSTYTAIPGPHPLKAKWVKILSNKPLTKDQVSPLARGTNFAVVPLYSPKGECITAVEEAYLKLPKVTEELRWKPVECFSVIATLNPNISR